MPTTPGTPTIARRPATRNHREFKEPATAIMPVTAWMQATAGMQATALMPATSNSKEVINSMTAHNNMNTSSSRNESNIRTTNTVWTPAKAGMLTQVVKPATACRETNYSRDTINIRDDSSRDNRHIMDINRSRTARTR
jgi:hypothetical protein